MNLKEIEFDQIDEYIKQEKVKGRSMKDIVKELDEVRSDVTILSHDPVIGKQQILAALKNINC